MSTEETINALAQAEQKPKRRARRSKKAEKALESLKFPFYVLPTELNYDDPKKTYTVVVNNLGRAYPYGKIPVMPVEELADGIRVDFNHGCRVFIPETASTPYKLEVFDADKNLCIYTCEIPPGLMAGTNKKFYIRYRIKLTKKGEDTPSIDYTMDLKDRLVLVQSNGGGIGDAIAWFSNVDAFAAKHKCRLLVVLDERIIPLFRNQYTHIRFIPKEETTLYKPYASYYLGLFFCGDTDNQPIDFRQVGLHEISAYILGIQPSQKAPLVDLHTPRQIKEKYVVISTLGTTHCKNWNNPYGWINVIKFLKENGYRVLCIDKGPVSTVGSHFTTIPYGCEDFTGDLPLQKRVDILKDADFFIGLSSGISWLAWCCNIPVVMISGFTETYNEFYTPYRIINPLVCHGCWNDQRENFDHYDYNYCPRKKGTPDEFACTRFITPEQVIETIKTIPSFKAGTPND